jgi:hypothetical protein
MSRRVSQTETFVEAMGNLKAGDTAVRRAADEIRERAPIQTAARSK